MTATVDASGSPGSGSSRPPGRASTAFRAGLRAGRSPVKRIDRFDPSPFRSQVAAQVDDFDPLGHGCRRRPPASSTGSASSGSSAGQLALDGRRRCAPGEDGARRPGADRDLPRQRARRDRVRRGAARAVHGARASGRSPRTSRWPCSAARRRPTSASRSTSAARSSRRRTRARPAPSRSARRSARSGPARSTRRSPAACEVPLSPLAFGAFDIIRALSPGSNDDPGACRAGRSTPGATASSWARAPRCSCSRRTTSSERRGVEPYAEVMGYGATSDAHHMVQPRADGREAARAATIALADAGVEPDEIDYVSAHASSTPIGDIAEARAIALALGERAARRARSAGRRRCTVTRSARRARSRRRSARWRSATAGLPRRSTSTSRTPRRRRAPAGPPARGPRRGSTGGSCRRRSGSAASTPRSSSVPPKSAGKGGGVDSVRRRPPRRT